MQCGANFCSTDPAYRPRVGLRAAAIDQPGSETARSSLWALAWWRSSSLGALTRESQLVRRAASHATEGSIDRLDRGHRVRRVGLDHLNVGLRRGGRHVLGVNLPRGGRIASQGGQREDALAQRRRTSWTSLEKYPSGKP